MKGERAPTLRDWGEVSSRKEDWMPEALAGILDTGQPEAGKDSIVKR
jgi:hypothetical protein